ncbi:MAG TPA: hypothetical protein VGI93_09395 [Steroidobacteraceae bacterium]|jgi:hypothetical protein
MSFRFASILLPLGLIASATGLAQSPVNSSSGNIRWAAADPFTIPADNAPVEKAIDYRLLPDVVGIHLGMPAGDALAALSGQYKPIQQSPLVRFPGAAQPALMEFSFAWNGLGFPYETIVVEATPPPQKSAIWRIWRRLGNAQHPMLHSEVLSSLRQKYGKETAAFGGNANGEPMGSNQGPDAAIEALWWIFDEQGHRTPMPAAGVGVLRPCLEVFARGDIERSQTIFRGGPANEPVTQPGICTASLVLVRASFGTQQMLTSFTVDAVDMPLASRAARATELMVKGADAHARQQELQKAGENKPKL